MNSGDGALNAMVLFFEEHNFDDQVTEIRVIRYRALTLLITIMDNDATVRTFLHGIEQFGRELDQSERREIVAQMIRAGLKQVTISKMLKTPASTISKDVQFFKLNAPFMLVGKSKIRKTKVASLPVFSNRAREKKFEKPLPGVGKKDITWGKL